MKIQLAKQVRYLTVAAALLASLAGPAAVVPNLVRADNTPSGDTAKQMATVTVVYKNTKGEIVTSNQHQIENGATINSNTFMADYFDQSGEYGISFPFSDFTNVVDGQTVTFVLGHKYSTQIIYLDDSNAEVAREKIDTLETQNLYSDQYHIPSGYVFADNSLQPGKKSPAEYQYSSDGPVYFHVTKPFTATFNFVDESGKVIDTSTFQNAKNTDVHKFSAPYGYEFLPNSQQPNSLDPTKATAANATPVAIKIKKVENQQPQRDKATTPVTFVDAQGNVIGKTTATGYKNDHITIKAPAGYSFLSESSNSVYNDGTATTVKVGKDLKVPYRVTDENGQVILSQTLTGIAGNWIDYPDLPGKYSLATTGEPLPTEFSDEKPITATAIDMSKYTHITYVDPAGNQLANKYIKDDGTGHINIANAVPAGYHLSSQQPATITAHNDEDWSVLVSNQPESSFVTTITRDVVQSTANNQTTPAKTDVSKFSGVATITAKAGAKLYSDAETNKEAGSTLPAGSKWHVFFVRQAADDTLAYDLGGGQWIKAGDALIDGAPAAAKTTAKKADVKETKASGLFIVKVPGKPTWSTVLWTKDGKATSHFLKANTVWKILAKKTLNGKQYYRLGTQNQWVKAQYGQLGAYK